MASLEPLAERYLCMLSKTSPSSNFNDLKNGLEALMRATGLSLAVRGMLSFGIHLSNANFAATYPGAVKEPKPVNPVAPTPDMENYSNLLKDYNHKLSRRVLFDSLVLLLISSILSKIPKDDVDHLMASDAARGDPCKYFKFTYNYLDDKYGVLTNTAVLDLCATTSGDLNHSTSLSGNITKMVVANKTLTRSSTGFSDHQMVTHLMAKLKKNPRTAELVADYKKRPRYVANAVDFKEFSDYCTTQYDTRDPPAGTAAFAFACDPDHFDSPTSSIVSTPVKSEASVVAATISPGATTTLTQDEYKELVASASAPRTPGTSKSKTKGANLKPAPYWCTLCGYGDHGPEKITRAGSPAYCFKLADRSAQVSCSTPTGPPVDGMVRSQAVKKGYKKP